MRIVSLLLVLCMLLSFAACNAPVDPVESGDATDSTTPEETTTADTMEIQTGDAYYPVANYLPSETYDGEEILIWIDGSDGFYNYREESIIEGDIVQEAVLERNAAVESTYDVVLNWDRMWTGGYRDQAQFRQSILAGDEYDIAGGPCLHMNPQLVYGCYVDLATLDNIDLSQPWWIQDATKNQRVYDKQYVGVGYFDFPTVARIGVYYFNDLMITDYRLENPYDLVESGEWTWEKLLEMGEVVAEDVNQDGVLDGADKYALSTRWDAWITQTATTGYQYVSRNEEGEYVITGVTDDLLELSGKIYPFITGSPMHFSRYTYKVDPKFPAAKDAEGKAMFCNSQILFMLEQLSWTGTTQLRDFGAYGILPPPKYLSSMEDYGSASSCYSSSIVVTTGNLEITSVILEALQIESYNILRPAYITDALSYKYLSDPRAIATLNIIFRQMNTEWSYNFANAGIGTTLCFALPTQEFLASFFHKNSSAVQQKVNDFLESVSNMP